MMNLFQPSVKLAKKVRVGSRLTRVYDAAQTPLDRVAACPEADPVKVAALQRLRERTDPFALAQAIDQKLERIVRLATHRRSPKAPMPQQPLTASPPPLSRVEHDTLHTISQIFGMPVYVNSSTRQR